MNIAWRQSSLAIDKSNDYLHDLSQNKVAGFASQCENLHASSSRQLEVYKLTMPDAALDAQIFQ